MALPHELQYLVAAGFQAHVHHGQSFGPESLQFFIRTDADAGRRGVAGNTLAFREQLPNGVQDGVQLRRLPN